MEINSNLTQFLENEKYLAYYYMFKLNNLLDCLNCDNIPEGPGHVSFHCPRFRDDTENLKESLGRVTNQSHQRAKKYEEE